MRESAFPYKDSDNKIKCYRFYVKDTVCQLPQVLLYHFTRYL